MDDRMKNVFAPSEKVRKMYEAIAAYVEEKRDLSTVKVSEITSRAGIGKGTAYEYFSSKEEIIVHATMWLCGQQLNQMTEGISKRGCFKEKFFFLLEWIQEHKEYNELILKSMKGSFQGDCEKIKTCVPAELANQVREHIVMQINTLLEQGYQEGIFTEQNVEKRIIIFFGTLMQYNFGEVNRQEFGAMQMSEAELREFTYDCMVKALN